MQGRHISSNKVSPAPSKNSLFCTHKFVPFFQIQGKKESRGREDDGDRFLEVERCLSKVIEARGLVVHWPQSRFCPSAAGDPRFWLLPKACVGDVDVG
ncbi:hypothetical protein GH733_010437 [Mirounga leonina]|nr:hypothetical protein GH733_010437 [Mirounga leonina]